MWKVIWDFNFVRVFFGDVVFNGCVFILNNIGIDNMCSIFLEKGVYKIGKYCKYVK